LIFILNEKSAFTAIELISVLMVISVLSLVVINRGTNINAETSGSRAVINNHIRFSQLMAMKSNTICGIQFAGSVYWIFRNGSIADKITLPNSNNPDFPIPSVLGTTTEIIYFDLWGVPYSDAALTTLRPSGAIGGLGITMSMDTGYVQ